LESGDLVYCASLRLSRQENSDIGISHTCSKDYKTVPWMSVASICREGGTHVLSYRYSSYIIYSSRALTWLQQQCGTQSRETSKLRLKDPMDMLVVL